MCNKNFEMRVLDKRVAAALLEYIAMEDCKTKQNMAAICGDKISEYLKLIDECAKEYKLTQEDVLNQIIENNI